MNSTVSMRAGAVERDALAEGAVDRALTRGAVVADDQVDQRVVEDLQAGQGVDEPADVVVGVLQESGVDLHLPGQHRLQVVGHVVPGRDLRRSRGQLGVGRDDPGLPLPLDGLLAQRVPAGVEPAGVPVGPLLRHVVRCVGGAGGEVDEERLVRHQRLLLADPLDRPVGHVLGEVVALLGGPVRLDRHRVPVDRRRPLVGLGADEAVEVLEPAATGGPGVERSHRAGLPHRHLVALAELGGGVAVQLQRLRQRRLVLRPDRAVPGRRRGDLGDPAHADRVMVAARQQRLTRRRAQRGRVEPGVAQPALGEPLEVRRAGRAAERRRRAEPRIIEQDHQHVRRARRRPQRHDRRKRRVRILRVVGRQPDMLRIRDRQDCLPMI